MTRCPVFLLRAPLWPSPFHLYPTRLSSALLYSSFVSALLFSALFSPTLFFSGIPCFVFALLRRSFYLLMLEISSVIILYIFLRFCFCLFFLICFRFHYFLPVHHYFSMFLIAIFPLHFFTFLCYAIVCFVFVCFFFFIFYIIPLCYRYILPHRYYFFHLTP